MRAVLTRVKHASVSVDGKVIGQIGEGFLVLLGVTHEDTEAQAVKLADKLTGLRIFEDEHGKMNRGLTDGGRRAAGRVPVHPVRQLQARAAGRTFWRPRGRRWPSPCTKSSWQLCRDKGFHTETGEFGAYMQVDSLNDGPLTIIRGHRHRCKEDTMTIENTVS